MIINEDKIYDMVISIDVLEHIPEQDIDWVLDRIISKAKKYVFLKVCFFVSFGFFLLKKILWSLILKSNSFGFSL